MYIYNITLVPANMAVNGVFRVRGGGTGAWNLYTRKKRECGREKKGVAFLLSPLEFPNRRLFTAVLPCHTLSVDRLCMCVRA